MDGQEISVGQDLIENELTFTFNSKVKRKRRRKKQSPTESKEEEAFAAVSGLK